MNKHMRDHGSGPHRDTPAPTAQRRLAGLVGVILAGSLLGACQDRRDPVKPTVAPAAPAGATAS